MQNYNTIIGVIQMRQNECSIRVIREGVSHTPYIRKKFRKKLFSIPPGKKTACKGGLFGWSFSVSKAA